MKHTQMISLERKIYTVDTLRVHLWYRRISGIVLTALLVPLTNPPKYPESDRLSKDISQIEWPFRPLASVEPDEYCNIPHVEHVTGETNYFCDAGLMYQQWYENFIDTCT